MSQSLKYDRFSIQFKRDTGLDYKTNVNEYLNYCNGKMLEVILSNIQANTKIVGQHIDSIPSTVGLRVAESLAALKKNGGL